MLLLDLLELVDSIINENRRTEMKTWYVNVDDMVIEALKQNVIAFCLMAEKDQFVMRGAILQGDAKFLSEDGSWKLRTSGSEYITPSTVFRVRKDWVRPEPTVNKTDFVKCPNCGCEFNK